MMDKIEFVGALVHLNGGEVVGKTRLQKTVYLLEAKELGIGFDFNYHKFGPFSSELSFAIDDAELLGFLKTEQKLGFHSVPFVTFKSTEKAAKLVQADQQENQKNVLDAIRGYTAIQLELAATAVYLKRHGNGDSFWEDVKRRKPLKSRAPNIEEAKKLVEELQL